MKKRTGFKLTACLLLVMLVIACVAVGTASATTTAISYKTVTSAWYGVKDGPTAMGYVNVTAIVNAAAQSQGQVCVDPEGYGSLPNLEITDPDLGLAKELDITTADGNTFTFHDGDEVVFSLFNDNVFLPLKSPGSIQSASYSVVKAGYRGIPSPAPIDVTSAVKVAASSRSPILYSIYALPATYQTPNLGCSDPAVGYVKELVITYTNFAGATSTFTCYDFNKLTFVYPTAILPSGGGGGTESFPILSATPSYYELFGF